MPNSKNIKAWVEALRSGKYEQVQGCLRDSYGYCCLGVACELHRLANGGEWDGVRRYLGESETLPAVVVEWLGVAGDDPLLDGEIASVLNDMVGLDFDAIADLIEREFLG